MPARRIRRLPCAISSPCRPSTKPICKEIEKERECVCMYVCVFVVDSERLAVCVFVVDPEWPAGGRFSASTPPLSLKRTAAAPLSPTCMRLRHSFSHSHTRVTHSLSLRKHVDANAVALDHAAGAGIRACSRRSVYCNSAVLLWEKSLHAKGKRIACRRYRRICWRSVRL